MMTFMIDKAGFLQIDRKSGMLNAMCPFIHTPISPHKCGCWCSLFGEPTRTSGLTVTLDLCHKTLCCDARNFTDLREQPDQQPGPA